LYVKQSIRVISVQIVAGAILAGAVLLLFLQRLKPTLIIGLAIPISILATFSFMYASNQNMNLLTLGGLALGIGMMVDNAIVILENIDRYRQQGMSLTEAALIGTQEVVKPLVAATLTTVIVFLPMLFVEGLAGQLFRPLALVVSLALISSLITSFFFVPVLSTHLLPDRHKSASENRQAANRSTKKRDLVTERFSRTFSRLRSAYLHLLGWSLRRPGKVALVLIAVVLLSLVCLPLIGTEFLPHLDESVLYMTVRMPVGTPLEQTRSTALDVVERIEDIPEIQAVYTSVGGTGEFQIAAGTLSNRANFSIPLSPVGERARSDHDIADDIRSRLHNVPGANITVSAGETSGLGGPPIAVQVRGPDTEVLASLAESIRSRISLIDGVEGIETAVESSQEEVRITPDRFRAAQHGISTAQIAEKIREATQGIVATRLQRQGDELDVRLAYYDGNVNQLDRLGWLEIESAHGINVPLSQLVTITEDTRPHTIARTDHLRQTEVRAQLYNRDLGSTMREIRQALEEDIVLPNGYSIHFGGQNDDMIEAFYYLGMALIVAVLLVYMVLAAQFESLTHPLLIMLAIPLAFAGTLIGLWMTGRPLGVGAMVGLLILSGIVVNNSIVFIDYVESMRKNGMTRQEALLQAGSVRIRPILMTTLTTVLGLLPLTLGIGEGSEIQAPLATTVVFGLTFATVLTLIWIPVMYELLERWKEKHASNASE
jgi:hydrophobic/amphiphilic exporter-1 (mainly G- bacteria), HAE1 family